MQYQQKDSVDNGVGEAMNTVQKPLRYVDYEQVEKHDDDVQSVLVDCQNTFGTCQECPVNNGYSQSNIESNSMQYPVEYMEPT